MISFSMLLSARRHLLVFIAVGSWLGEEGSGIQDHLTVGFFNLSRANLAMCRGILRLSS
jgi:hypothetical protein